MERAHKLTLLAMASSSISCSSDVAFRAILACLDILQTKHASIDHLLHTQFFPSDGPAKQIGSTLDRA